MTQIELSCPSCGTLNMTEMNQSKEIEDMVSSFMIDMFGKDDVESYRFSGSTKCKNCKSKYMTTLSVTTLEKENQE